MGKNTQIAELINYLSVNASGDVVLTGGLVTTGGATYATQSFVSTNYLAKSGGTLTGNTQINISSNSGSGSTFPRFQVVNTLATQGDGSTTYNFADIRLSSGNGAVDMYMSSTYAVGTWEPQGIINVSTNHPLAFKTNNTERARFSAAGNFGIGTTSPSYKLSVANEFQVGAQGGNDFTYISGGSGYGSVIRNYYASGSINNEIRGNGVNYFNSVTGNFLIGTSTDLGDAKLQTIGHIRIGTWTTPGSTYIGFGRNDNGSMSAAGSSGIEIESVSVIGNYSQNVHLRTHYYNNGSSRVLTALYNGSVGIGTTSPSGRLGVKTSGADGIILEQDTSDANNSGRLFFPSAAQTFAMLNNAGDLRFTYAATPGNTSGTSLARFTNTGKYFRMESGTGGIQFQGTTGASSALNYYEQGSWTPGLSAGGSAFTMGGINDGRYIRIGNQVTVTGHLQWTGGSGSGTVIITGLPFTSTGVRSAGSIGAVSYGISFNSGYGMWVLVNDPNHNDIYIIQLSTSGSGYSHTPPVGSTGVIYGFSLTYFIL